MIWLLSKLRNWIFGIDSSGRGDGDTRPRVDTRPYGYIRPRGDTRPYGYTRSLNLVGPPAIVETLPSKLLKDRVKSFGDFNATANRGYLVEELKYVPFPNEYADLLSLPKLNEATLKPKRKVWELLFSRPSEVDEIVKKQVLLVCLNFAQSKILESIPIFEGASLSHVSTKPIRFDYLKYNFNLKFASESNASVRVGSHLLFAFNGNPNVTLRVIKINQDSLELAVDIRYSSVLKDEEEYRDIRNLLTRSTSVVAAFEKQSDFIPQAMLRSIERIKSGVINHIIKPPGKPKVSGEDFKLSMNRLLPDIVAKTKLNEAQSRAFYSICTTSHGNSPYVLHGPPGTGKTLLIAKAVHCLLEMDPKVRVLLTAPSNMAADVIAEKLMEEFDKTVMNKDNVLRLKSTGNDFWGRNKNLDPIMNCDFDLEKFKIPTELHRYRIIVCTLGCSTHIINQNIPPGFFTHIFLDEAGQAGDGEIWIPLGGLATKDTSVVLCGDPKQLGPVCTLELPVYITKNFDSSLVRYMKMEIYKTDPRLFCRLERSYRCHHNILDIASRLFYESTLLSAITHRPEPFLNWSALPNKAFPIIFVDVKGTEICQKNSYANLEEIDVILKYIDKIYSDFPSVEPSEIGIISPYRHQTRLIKQRFFARQDQRPNATRRKITTDSVERFQGSERKLIILTTTRTNGLGFIGDDLRLNTSITRAKHLLIVIGHKENLTRHKSWKAFIDYCSKNNAVITWDDEVPSF